MYGTLGSASSSNTPGDRDSAATWMDPDGDLWLFGGEGHDASGAKVVYDDLWQYSSFKHAWIWEGGSKSSTGQKGVYGTRGTPSASNIPGSRYGAATWLDPDGNAWIFGGWGYDSTGASGYLNDLWEFSNVADSDTGTWVWVAGSNTIGTSGGRPGVYGSLGEPGTSSEPGARIYASTWVDTNGNLWLFGGDAFDSAGKQGNLNDLWVFSETNDEWAWMGGSDKLGSPNGTPGSYGTRGTPGSTNIPGGRNGAVTWYDSNRNLWLFGGVGVTTAGNYGYLNDLWVYGGGQWTWMNGSATVNSKGYAPADYGTQGGEAPANTPGGRANGVAWTDTNGNLWLMGGIGADASGNVGSLNDLWTLDYNNGEWTWMGGSKSANSAGTYGTLGTGSPGNIPPGRENALGWSEPNWGLWLYGGLFNTGTSTRSYLDDLWEFTPEIPPVNPASATLSATSLSLSAYVGYTNQGAVRITNEGNGDLYLDSVTITGSGASAFSMSYGCPNPISVGLFCQINLTFTPKAATTYSAVLTFVDNATNSPQAVQLTGTGKILPVYQTTTTLTASATTVAYGTSLELTAGVTEVGGTSPIYGLVTFYDGPVEIFSGDMVAGKPLQWSTDVLAPGTHSITATYAGDATDDPSKSKVVTVTVSLPTSEPAYNWTWLEGPGTPSDGILPEYGTLADPSTSNLPGDRASATTWMDDAGNLYLFGGQGYAESGAAGLLNDLWMFNPSQHTWITYSSPSATLNAPNRAGQYGADPNPGSRYGASAWTDSLGHGWLFGGYGYDSTGTEGYLNDLWTYYGGWTWKGGSSTIGSAKGVSGVYGTLGTPGTKNIPGSRVYAASWTDSQKRFWLFGGYGYDANGAVGYLNDLWMYNPTSGEWTWEGGDSKLGTAKGEPGVYGAKGSANTSNLPGGRSAAAAWTDWKGDFWLFGGQGVTTALDTKIGYLNDLWMYNPASHEWTWVNGNTAVNSSGNQPGNYGKLGVSSAANVPGGRANGSSWIDFNGHLWLFGGAGLDSKGTSGNLGDQWMFNPSTGQWTWERGSSLVNAVGSNGTQGVAVAANSPGAREQQAYWSGLTGGVWMYGGMAAQAEYADLWTYSPESTPAEAPVVRFSVPVFKFRGQVNVASPAQTVTLTNTGTAALTIQSISFIDSAGYAFKQTNNCGASVAVGASCAISVKLDSDMADAPLTETAALAVKDNAWNSAQTVGLTDYTTSTPWIATTTTLAASPSQAAAGATVTLTATVKTSSGVPTGNVSFYDGMSLIGWVKLTSTGSTTVSTNLLAPGTHTITATYNGDFTYGASTSNTTTVKVSAP